ncbi:MAG: hypothetical protein HZB29_09890 [Nitrospinae bacterium]|nr:hypothetical protein [Nitrospinota bacterium]
MCPAAGEAALAPRAFDFDGERLQEACWINGKPYFTRRAIGEWLEYENPQKAVDNIISRNPHISDPRWSSTLNLRVELTTGKGGNSTYERESEQEVYSPVGLQLIVFESGQPKAREYKIWVANLVHAFMSGELKEPPRTISFFEAAMMDDGEMREKYLIAFAMSHKFLVRGGERRHLQFRAVKARADRLRRKTFFHLVGKALMKVGWLAPIAKGGLCAL